MTPIEPTYPAFPKPGDSYSQSDSQDGMALLTYFAAHAPHPIPEWFEPKMDDRPTAPTLGPCSPAAQVLAYDWRKDPHYDINVPVANDLKAGRIGPDDAHAVLTYALACDAWHDVVTAWRERQKRQRIAQWPWVWAKLVLAAGGAQ